VKAVHIDIEYISHVRNDKFRIFGFTAITDIYDDEINKDTKETSMWTV